MLCQNFSFLTPAVYGVYRHRINIENAASRMHQIGLILIRDIAIFYHSKLL